MFFLFCSSPRSSEAIYLTSALRALFQLSLFGPVGKCQFLLCIFTGVGRGTRAFWHWKNKFGLVYREEQTKERVVKAKKSSNWRNYFGIPLLARSEFFLLMIDKIDFGRFMGNFLGVLLGNLAAILHFWQFTRDLSRPWCFLVIQNVKIDVYWRVADSFRTFIWRKFQINTLPLPIVFQNS